MKYRSLFAVLISTVMLFSLLSCMKRAPLRIGDAERMAPADTAYITIPEDIEVVSVDGQRIKSFSDYILSTVQEINVTPGEHLIVVRYNAFWDRSNLQKQEEIKSKKVALKFNAARGGLYTITHPEVDDRMAAKKLAENPNIWIAKVGKYSGKELNGTRVSRSAGAEELRNYTEHVKTPPIIENDTALKEEWYSMSNKEKEEFRKWLEWNNMSQDEKKKFREWKNNSDRE